MRISATTLEAFRLFMQPDQEWMPEAELQATIRGEFVPTHRVLLGQAFGKVLETPEPYRVDGGYRITTRGVEETFAFGDDVIGPALLEYDRRGVCEAKGTKQYGPHTVVAKADQIIGAEILETKSTLGYFNFDKYAGSYQWRFMADIFQPSRVTYCVFCLDEDESKGVIRLKSVERFTLYPYLALHEDCVDLLRQFVSYVEARQLTGYLQEAEAA